ncbi:hypothetical protein OBBRIDRAFT_792221 [Obba rivulosa]|uniref:BTB domain-containing protein n=1 Tax=Obba rivulosa TaxID=1052685 RepID=A0A8E2B3D9_9APHY|nr:hypothetical protein OBBRIDRAFT_792221 [Obba rivulosa]
MQPVMNPEPSMRFEHPFTKPNADAIFRSCDGVDFRVHRAILSEASPMFETMFSLPQPSTPSSDCNDLPAILMAETATTLNAVLHFCYPMPEFDFTTIDVLAQVLEAGRKYAIDAILSRAVRPLRGLFLDEDPFAVFAVAYNMKMADEALLAAHESLKWDVPDASKLGMVPGAAFVILMHWRARCVVTAIDFMHGQIGPEDRQEGEWYISDQVDWLPCSVCKECGYFVSSDWGECESESVLRQRDFVQYVVSALAKRPCGSALLEEDIEGVAFKIIPDDLNCMGCQKTAMDMLYRSILPGLCNALDNALKRTVPLMLDF